MANDGKKLETLVRQIEETLVPEGFVVDANRKVYDESGNQLAELDIEIKGRVGSGTFHGLIECRDRPSEGPAPVSWIEQLVGRRERLKLDKVMAVSSTGFSAAAKSAATSAGIELRILNDISADGIGNWMRMRHMTQVTRMTRLIGARLNIADSEDEATKGAVTNLIKAANAKDEILTSTETVETLTLHQASSIAFAEAPQIFDGLEANGSPRSVKLHVSYPSDESHYTIATQVGPVRIREIVFSAEVSLIEEHVSLSTTVEYRRDGDADYIAQVAGFPIEINGVSYSVEFHRMGEAGLTRLLLRKVD